MRSFSNIMPKIATKLNLQVDSIMRHANRRRSKKVEKYLVGREKMLTFAPAKVRIALARMLTIH